MLVGNGNAFDAPASRSGWAASSARSRPTSSRRRRTTAGLQVAADAEPVEPDQQRRAAPAVAEVPGHQDRGRLHRQQHARVDQAGGPAHPGVPAGPRHQGGGLPGAPAAGRQLPALHGAVQGRRRQGSVLRDLRAGPGPEVQAMKNTGWNPDWIVLQHSVLRPAGVCRLPSRSAPSRRATCSSPRCRSSCRTSTRSSSRPQTSSRRRSRTRS